MKDIYICVFEIYIIILLSLNPNKFLHLIYIFVSLICLFSNVIGGNSMFCYLNIDCSAVHLLFECFRTAWVSVVRS